MNPVSRTAGIAAGVLLCSGAVFATDYSDDMSDASAWIKLTAITGSQTPVTTPGQTGMVDFKCQPGAYDKCVWDHNYTSSKPSLEGFNALRIKLSIDHPEALSGFGLYLNLPANSSGSVTDWHALNLPILVAGEQEILLPFYKMKRICSTAPCPKVDNLSQVTTVRLSPYRKTGNTQDFTLTVDSIEPVDIPVALLQGSDYTYNEALSRIMERYGIGYFPLTTDKLADPDSTTSLPSLTGVKILMGNYVDLDATRGTYVAGYLSGSSGLKFIGYGPQLLGASGNDMRGALGLPTLTGGANRIESVSAMEFTDTWKANLQLPTKRLPGFYSWLWPVSNSASGTATAEPIAYWVSSATNPPTVLGKPAWLLNSAGAYRDKTIANVYHPNDNDHVLLALMMQLRPDMAADIVDKVQASVDRFAAADGSDIGSLVELMGSALNNLNASPEKTDAQSAQTAAATAYASVASGTALVKLNGLLEARKQLTKPYSLLVQPPDNSEVKAIWVTNAWGPTPGDWLQPMAKVAAAGFTHVSVNVASIASVSYPSALMCTAGYPTTTQLCVEPHPDWLDAQAKQGTSPLQPALEDPLAAGVAAAHAYGLKYIAWKKAFTLSGSTSGMIDWFKTNNLAQSAYAGSSGFTNISAATPCSPLVRQHDLDVIADIVDHYDVDGIQLDYIRFDSVAASFDSQCAAGFAQHLSDTHSALSCSFPGDVNAATSTKSACVSAYKTYLTDLVTEHVAAVHTLIQSKNASRPSGKPEVELSADVFATGNEDLKQDWPAWTGYLARMFPMTYFRTLADFQTAVNAAHAKLPTGSSLFPLHFGLGGFEATPDIIVRQIDWLRQQQGSEGGFPNTGFSFFELNPDSLENMLPMISGAIAFPDQDGDGVRDDSDPCPQLPNTSVCEHGLTASYYNDGTGNTPTFDAGRLALTRVDANVDFDWIYASPGTGVDADNFSVAWTGQIVPPVTGTYEFCTESDDGSRLWIDSKLVVSQWQLQEVAEDCGTVDLQRGVPVPIRMEFFDGPEDAIAHLEWSYPGQSKVIVPTSALFSE